MVSHCQTYYMERFISKLGRGVFFWLKNINKLKSVETREYGIFIKSAKDIQI